METTLEKVTFLAASLGVLVFVAYQLIGIVPEPYGQVVTIVFTSVTFGLSASGYYKFVAKRLPKQEAGMTDEEFLTTTIVEE